MVAKSLRPILISLTLGSLVQAVQLPTNREDHSRERLSLQASLCAKEQGELKYRKYLAWQTIEVSLETAARRTGLQMTLFHRCILEARYAGVEAPAAVVEPAPVTTTPDDLLDELDKKHAPGGH